MAGNTGTAERTEGRQPELALFEKHIVDAEARYGVKLSCDIGRNVRVTNGDTNQWIGEVWYYDGPTKISVTASNLNFERMIGELSGHITLALKTHAEVRKVA